MLSERDLELLTAYVDGELTPRQRQAALSLLNGSSEARSFLQDLQETAHRLHELPRRQLGSAFAGQVLRTIADRGLQPAPEARLPTHRPWQGWMGYLAAACLVLAVGVTVYLVTRQSPNTDNVVVENPPKKQQPEVVPDNAPKPPLQLTFKELAQQPKRALLAQQLAKESAVHLDLTVRDHVRAVHHLEDVLKGEGIQPIFDPKTLAELDKKGQGKTEYFIYAENVDVKELEKILGRLAEEPRPGDGWVESQPSKGPLKSSFESLVVTSMSMADRERLADLTGVPAAEFSPRRHGDFDNKPFQPSTSKDIIEKRNLTFPRDDDRYAMVIASNVAPGPMSSPAMKTFLANRQEQRPGTVQVLLVIRQA